MGGVYGVGNIFRIGAQQASRFFNLIWPGASSAISSGIAAFGTAAIGDAAIAYYIDGITSDVAKMKFEKKIRETS